MGPTLILSHLKNSYTTAESQGPTERVTYTQLNCDDSEDVCETRACKDRAALIKEYINETAKPCDDFYAFACGKWVTDNPLPLNKDVIGTFSTIQENIYNDIGGILNRSHYTFNDQTPLNQMLIMYNYCLRDGNVSFEEHERVVFNILKGKNLTVWPRISRMDDGTETVANIMGRLGWNWLIDTEVKLDPENVSNYVLHMSQPVSFSVGLYELRNFNDSENEALFTAYKSRIMGYMKHFSPKLSEEDAKELTDGVFNLQVQLAMIANPPGVRETYLHIFRKMTVQELSQSSNIDWLTLLNQRFTKADETITADDEVIIWHLSYYQKLMDLLHNIDKTALYNFLGWTIVAPLGEYVSPTLYNLTQNFRAVKHGRIIEYVVWKKCIDIVKIVMGMGIARLYVQEKFSKDAENETEGMVKNIQNALAQRLRTLDWMDNATKAEALNKLETMLLKTGYPQWIFDDAHFQEEFKFMKKFNENMTFLEMIMEADNNNRIIQLKKLRQKFDRQKHFVYQPTDVNAFYYGLANEIVFVAGLLRSPFYDYGLPASVNYGSLGVFVGHEITHAFDNQGSRHDSTGLLRNWWSSDTRRKFENFSDCFRYQYGRTLDQDTNMYINGNLTLGENIADNGGIRGAFKAYRKLAETNPNLDMSLPEVNYTSQQLFFISFAMPWCENSRVERLKWIMRNDPHTIARHRVNIPLRNMDEFSQAFSCNKDSKMFTTNKCVLW